MPLVERFETAEPARKTWTFAVSRGETGGFVLWISQSGAAIWIGTEREQSLDGTDESLDESD